VKRDPESARRVAERDDEVDRTYLVVYADLIRTMEANPAAVGTSESLLWVAKSLERSGDHVTNIAEWVVFMVTGELVELNQ
jgi:phosphate transport system protein